MVLLATYESLNITGPPFVHDHGNRECSPQTSVSHVKAFTDLTVWGWVYESWEFSVNQPPDDVAGHTHDNLLLEPTIEINALDGSLFRCPESS